MTIVSQEINPLNSQFYVNIRNSGKTTSFCPELGRGGDGDGLREYVPFQCVSTIGCRSRKRHALLARRTTVIIWINW